MRRRHVLRVAASYVVVGWVLIEVSSVILPTFEAPNWVMQVLTWLVIAGLPAALILAWAFQITPHGIQREPVPDAVLPLPDNTPAAAPEATPGPADKHSIAVLPFVNMSGDESNEYFSDGLTEELLNVLVKIRGLRVAARTSSFAFKGQHAEIAEIGAKLKVGSLLEGSVRKSADQVRITAQLINVSDGYHLWSETYDRVLDDIFAVQDDIARAVAKALHVTLIGSKSSEPARGTDNVDAYNLYLKGRHCLQREDEPSVHRAQEYFEQALEVDNGFAEAWVGLAKAFAWRAGWGGDLPVEYFPRARHAAEQALVHDPDQVHARLALSTIRFGYDWDFLGAIRECREAVRRNPGLAEPHFELGRLLNWLGEREEAISELRAALSLDPLRLAIHYSLAYVYSGLQDLVGTRAVLQDMAQIDPSFDVSWIESELLLKEGKPQEALAAISKNAQHWRQLYVRAVTHWKLGHKDQAQHALEQLIQEDGEDAAIQIAEIYGVWGDLGKGFEWLDRAITLRDPGVAQLRILFDNGNPMRADPRFAAVLKRVGL